VKPAELPFLVVHARVAWPIAVIVLTALVAAAWFVLRARYRRWSTASMARSRISMTEPVDAGTRMLRGVFHGSWIDCDGVRVEVHGTLDADGFSDGERVVIHGDVRRDGESWVLEPLPTHGAAWWRGENVAGPTVQRAATISAWAESPAVPPSTRTSRIVAVIASAAVAYGGLRLLGHRAAESLLRADHFEPPGAIGALSLATLVRATRDDALASYRDQLLEDRSFGHTEDEVRTQLALAELQGDCTGEAEILLAAGYWEQGREQAQQCGDQELRLKAASLTGHFEDIGPKTRPYWRGFAAIARQDWATASRVADDIAAADSGPETSCLREYLRLKAGRTFDGKTMLECDVIRAVHELKPTHVVSSLDGDALYEIATGCSSDWAPSSFFDIVNLGFMKNEDGDGWLGTLCPPSSTISSLTYRTQTALLRGDTAQIAGELAGYATTATTDERREAIEALRGLVQLRSDADLPYDRTIDRDSMDHASALRSGQPIEGDERGLDVLRAAETGDGGPLAAKLLAGDGPSQLDLIGVLPRIRTHRQEVLRALRIRWEYLGYREIASPFAASHYAALERDIARLAGDREAERRWQAIVDAHARAYTAKDVLVSLLVWEDLLDR
jgi:hypothetical protein